MARTRKPQADAATVIGYVRVSSAEQADSGLGLAAQEAAIRAECDRRGWTLAGIYRDAGVSGAVDPANRPALAEALAALNRGEAGALVASKLDRLARSMRGLVDLLDAATISRWSLIALDVAVDTSTPTGEAMANMLGVFAQLERRLIGQRTKDALAALKAEGARLGRPPTLPADVRHRIGAEHRAGASWSAIARQLEADGVPTAQGGAHWWPATVRAIALAADAA